MSGINKPIRPLVETESTVLQHHAESECKPFFVDLSSLPKSQLDHLKQVGLVVADIDDENNAGNDNDDDDDDGSPRPEEHSSSSLPEIQVLRSKHMSYVEQVWKRIERNAVPTPTGRYAGIGSRDLGEVGEKAIEDLYSTPGQPK